MGEILILKKIFWRENLKKKMIFQFFLKFLKISKIQEFQKNPKKNFFGNFPNTFWNFWKFPDFKKIQSFLLLFRKIWRFWKIRKNFFFKIFWNFFPESLKINFSMFKTFHEFKIYWKLSRIFEKIMGIFRRKKFFLENFEISKFSKIQKCWKSQKTLEKIFSHIPIFLKISEGLWKLQNIFDFSWIPEALKKLKKNFEAWNMNFF